MKRNPLKDIEGKKIRKQYFNVPIYLYSAMCLFVLLFVTFEQIYSGNFNFEQWIEDVFAVLFVFVLFIVPLLILSVLNRFLFGKIVCVLNEKGIYYSEGYTYWHDIDCLEYSATQLGRWSFYPAYIDIVCKKKSIRILSAPYYTLSVSRKYHSKIKTKFDNIVWFVLVFVILLGVISPLFL